MPDTDSARLPATADTCTSEKAERTRNQPLAALVVGLTFWWPFFRKFEYLALFGLYPNPAQTMWEAYTPTMLLLGTTLLIGAAAHTHIEAFLAQHRPLCCLVALMTTIGWLATYLSAETGGAAGAIRALGCILIAVGYAALTLCWGSSLSNTTARNAAAALAGSFALSTATQLTSFLPTAAMLGIATVAPAISALAWLVYKPTASHNDRAEAQPMPVAVIAMLGGFLIAGRVAVGLLSYVSDSIPAFDRIVTVAGTVAITVILICAAKTATDWGRLFQIAWSGLAILFMAGMFALLGVNDALSHLATAVLSSVLGCFEMILFVVLAISTSRAQKSGVAVFGTAVVLFRVLPNFAGKNLTPLLIGADQAWAQQLTAFVVPAMTFLLVVATIVFMNARIMGKVAWIESTIASNVEVEQPAADSHETLEPSCSSIIAQAPRQATAEETCQQLASQHGLTPRETDVLLLMSEGRSYQKIADTLGISLSTVQGHVKCVYRKLDVHTKQEIIEMVK